MSLRSLACQYQPHAAKNDRHHAKVFRQLDTFRSQPQKAALFAMPVMHSSVLCAGMKGGSVLNPINALAKLIAGMMDEDNHITVQGFYE